MNDVTKREFHDTISRFRLDNYNNSSQTWRRISYITCHLRLTVYTDKLPAASGVAEELRRQRGWTYLAGLWKENLLLDMCWIQDDKWKISREISPQPWRAPTWSAAVNRPILYNQPLYFSAYSCPDIEQCADILHAECSLAGLPSTGQVSGGFIELECYLIPAIYKRNVDSVITPPPPPTFQIL